MGAPKMGVRSPGTVPPSPAGAQQGGWGGGRGSTYPDGRVQVAHSHLLGTLHRLDHLLLVLGGGEGGMERGSPQPGVQGLGSAMGAQPPPVWGHPPPAIGTG